MACMKIWVDADACPKIVKDILFRAAHRCHIKIILVANSVLTVPTSILISTITVASGVDVTDNYIVEQLAVGDLVITADIPLAAEIVTKGGVALNPRGELYTADNIKQRLTMRDMMAQLRTSGLQINGPSTYGAKEKIAFANALDRFLTKFK
jgi:uncharacterized protein YaiI (UPF0178 family)